MSRDVFEHNVCVYTYAIRICSFCGNSMTLILYVLGTRGEWNAAGVRLRFQHNIKIKCFAIRKLFKFK